MDIKSHASLTTSLISYWDLEEASGTRYDLHGSNNLADNNTVTQQTGKVGNSAKFTSSNSEYLSIADASQTGLEPTGDMSWSFWVYFDTVPGAGSGACILGKGDGNQKYQILYSGNGEGLRLLFYPSSGTYKGVDYAWTPSATTWYHVVVTFNATASSNNFQVFVNNSKTQLTGASAPCGSISGNTNPFYLGVHVESPTTYFLNGRLEEVGMWNKVLSDTEVSDLYNSGNGLPYYDPADVKNDTTLSTSLSVYYEMEETGASARVDSTATGYNLTATGSPPSAAGKLSNAVDFEGSPDQLSKTSETLHPWTTTTNRSWSGWFYADSVTGVQGLWGYYDGTESGHEWLVYLNGTSLILLAYNSGAAITYGTAISTGTWYHVVVTNSDADAQIMYVNGVRAGSASVAPAGTTNALTFQVGCYGHSSPTGYFNGRVDELAGWTKILTVAEVRALYGYGTPPVYDAGGGGGATFTPRASFFM